MMKPIIHNIKTNDTRDRKHICQADSKQIKTPKQITAGLRTELVPYEGAYLTEENAIKAIGIYHKQGLRYRRLSDEDLAKMVKWFINDRFDEHNSLETTLTDFYNYLNYDAE